MKTRTDAHPDPKISRKGNAGSRPSYVAVIPAYNSAATVAEAVLSLINQTAPPVEVIVVDDGSTDDTAVIAAQAGARVIRQENAGPAAARNAGIRASDADWIVLLDADDLAYPERCAIQSRHLDDPAVAVVCTHSLQAAGSQISFDSLWRSNQIQTSTVFLRRAAWEEAGGFNESRALIGVEDYNLWLRLTHRGWKVLRLEAQLSEYRPTIYSLSGQIERFVLAEIANVASLAEQLDLPADRVSAKEQSIFIEYGLDMFHERRLDTARRFLREASQFGPLAWPLRFRLWMTHMPALARMLK